MTTFDTERMARGWGLIAEGAMELSLAYSAIEPAAARAAVPGAVPSVPAASAAGDVPPSLAAPSFDELPPDDEIRMKPQVEAGLGKCPTHGTAWSIRPAGVGAKGAYEAFYKCAERDESQPKGYCTQKPQKIWWDIHPIREGAAV